MSTSNDPYAAISSPFDLEEACFVLALEFEDATPEAIYEALIAQLVLAPAKIPPKSRHRRRRQEVDVAATKLTRRLLLMLAMFAQGDLPLEKCDTTSKLHRRAFGHLFDIALHDEYALFKRAPIDFAWLLFDALEAQIFNDHSGNIDEALTGWYWTIAHHCPHMGLAPLVTKMQHLAEVTDIYNNGSWGFHLGDLSELFPPGPTAARCLATHALLNYTTVVFDGWQSPEEAEETLHTLLQQARQMDPQLPLQGLYEDACKHADSFHITLPELHP